MRVPRQKQYSEQNTAGAALRLFRPTLIRPMICLVLLMVILGADLPDTAITKVREGLKHFHGQDYSNAETAFTEAGEIAPDNQIIAFDKACTALGADNFDKARELFRKVSLAKEPQLSVKAHYNLGSLEAGQAKLKLGEDPAAAEGEAREESIQLLLAAVGHYRDVLRVDRDHKDARHNLELIRLFIKHIQSQWAERDKQKERDEKDLLQFLKMIEDRETKLRTLSRLLEKEEKSTSRSQARRNAADSQSTLQEEIAPLKAKLDEQLQAAQAQTQQQQPGTPPTASAAPDDQMQEAGKILHQLADDTGTQMLAAASSINADALSDAVVAQDKALENLHQMYLAVAPYQDILQRAITDQASIAPDEQQTESDDDQSSGQSEDDEPLNTSAPVDDEKGDIDNAAESESQNRITNFSRMLSLKAEAELPSMQAQLASMPPIEAESESVETPDTPNAEEETTEQPAVATKNNNESETDEELTEEEKAAKAQQKQAEQQRRQLQGLVESMELAVKLGPDAEQHSAEASKLLLAEDVEEADAQQSETVSILREIAEPLVKDDQNQDQQQQNDQDQQKDGEKKEDQQNNDDQKKQDQKEDEQPSEQEKAEQQKEQKKEKQQQQAESLLRQARERERKHREMQKQLRAILSSRLKVDKDW